MGFDAIPGTSRIRVGLIPRMRERCTRKGMSKERPQKVIKRSYIWMSCQNIRTISSSTWSNYTKPGGIPIRPPAIAR